MAASLPVIDFSRWLKGSPEEKKAVAKDLAEACRGVGFVYIVNHGVTPELLDEAFSWSKKLFDLPEEKKMLAPHPPGKVFGAFSGRLTRTYSPIFRSQRPPRLLLARPREGLSVHPQRRRRFGRRGCRAP